MWAERRETISRERGEAPPPHLSAVAGGVPGGVAGGQIGGVIGGVIGGTGTTARLLLLRRGLAPPSSRFPRRLIKPKTQSSRLELIPFSIIFHLPGDLLKLSPPVQRVRVY